jgi:hypothetical protein
LTAESSGDASTAVIKLWLPSGRRSDNIYNRIAACSPGAQELLINLYGLLYKEITTSSALARMNISVDSLTHDPVRQPRARSTTPTSSSSVRAILP